MQISVREDPMSLPQTLLKKHAAATGSDVFKQLKDLEVMILCGSSTAS